MQKTMNKEKSKFAKGGARNFTDITMGEPDSLEKKDTIDVDPFMAALQQELKEA